MRWWPANKLSHGYYRLVRSHGLQQEFNMPHWPEQVVLGHYKTVQKYYKKNNSTLPSVVLILFLAAIILPLNV